MLYELYLITNQVNGKRYVGQCKESVGYLNRFQAHVYDALSTKGHKNLLHAAIRSHGSINFRVKRILKNIPEAQIDFYESLWILKLNTFYTTGKGYNMTLGGQGIHGYKHDIITRNKMALSSHRNWEKLKSEPVRLAQRNQQISAKLKGRRYSSITLQRMSKAAKKRFEEHPGTFTGKKHSEDSKDKISRKNGAAVLMIDLSTKKVLRSFQSAVKAANYLIKIGKTTNIYANVRILRVCKGEGRTAYGYGWKYKCND